ncbi:MAG: hypothetical protein M3178_18655 [Pseudomonadota bacterium]|nr:hypothetical protein [Pseudomonadota bacterium]
MLNDAEGETGKVSKLDEAKRFLRAALAKGERPQDEIKAAAAAQNISWGTLKRASGGQQNYQAQGRFWRGRALGLGVVMTIGAQNPCFDPALVALLWKSKECKKPQRRSSHILVSY